MLIFEWTLVLLVAAVGLAALARRWHAPYPSLLALLGCALVFVPGAPRFELQPELALALFVAPVLLDAAYDTSLRDLRDNWAPVMGLVVAAVAITTAAVAAVAHALVPGLPWAAAIALGAIVAPPDAAAATAVLSSAPLPHRLRQILEGESLLNDATALLTYRVAVAAAMGAGVGVADTAPVLVGVTIGSLLAGAALAWAVTRLLRTVEDVPTAIVLQFAGTFGVWIAAERVGLSGILTVVAYAIGIARVAPTWTPARIRIPSYAVWETTVFVLNALAFVLIGLQLGPLLERLNANERADYAMVALAVLGTVIATRIVWVMGYNTASRWKIRRFGSGRSRRPLLQPTVKGGVILSWCGMRGIVTLAAALALPGGEHPFPGRDLILVTAFVVVLGTLVLQGLTLRPLLLRLDLRDDQPVQRETQLARRAALRGALSHLQGDASPAAQTLRDEYERLWPADGEEERPASGDAAALPRLRRDAVAAARREIARLRGDGTIGDDAFHRVELQLDRAELYADTDRG